MIKLGISFEIFLYGWFSELRGKLQAEKDSINVVDFCLN